MTALEPFERAGYALRGPISLIVDQQRVIRADSMVIEYERRGGARTWTVRVRVDRSQLLPISEAGLLAPIDPLMILGFDIFRPIELGLRPRAELAAALDAVEDERSVVGRHGVLDAELSVPVKNLRGYDLVDIAQTDAGEQPLLAQPGRDPGRDQG